MPASSSATLSIWRSMNLPTGPSAAVEPISDGLLLSLKAKAGLALLAGTDPAVGGVATGGHLE